MDFDIDSLDDPTINLAISPRELSILNMALGVLSDEIKKGNVEMLPPTIVRMELLRDYVQDETLAQGA
jgi:hypothetical protein